MKAPRNSVATIASSTMNGDANQSFFFALLEHGLKRRQPDRHRRDPGPIAFPEQPELHRLLVERQRQRDDHDCTWHSVDEEDRLPAVVLGEIAADRRPYRRGEGHREGKQREADRLLRLWQFRQHDCEGHRYQNAAGEPLEAAHDNHRAEVVSEGAADREQRKQHRVDQQIAPKREHPAEIVGQRDDDDLADQVGGRDPGSVVDAGSDAALDIEQRSVGDLDVEDRHEGADHARENGDPVSRARARRSGAGDDICVDHRLALQDLSLELSVRRRFAWRRWAAWCRCSGSPTFRASGLPRRRHWRRGGSSQESAARPW